MFGVIPLVEFLVVLGVDIDVHQKNPSAFVSHVSLLSVVHGFIPVPRRVCTLQDACSPGKTHTRWDALCAHRVTRRVPCGSLGSGPGSAVAWCGSRLGTGVSCPPAACHRPAPLCQTGRGTSGWWSSGETRRAPRGHGAIVACLSAPHNPECVQHTTSTPHRVLLVPCWDISHHRCYTLHQAGRAWAACHPSMHETPAK